MDPDPGAAALQRFPSPFRINSACAKVFNQLVRMFLHSSFRFRLPWISEVGWNTIRGNIPESERLEFLGDLAIGDKIGNLLYFMHPTGTPGDYTVSHFLQDPNLPLISVPKQVKSVLTCNAFFAQIMYRLGHVRDGEGLKEVADAFEIVIGLYHMESGSRALEDWVWENFSPLAEAALDIYETTK